jgi:hypothetical protein
VNNSGILAIESPFEWRNFGAKIPERSQKRKQINKFDDMAVVECEWQISQASKVSEHAES